MNKKKNKQSMENTNEKHIRNKTNLSLSDVMCPICLNIMIEPITMPCNHCLCLLCFQENVSQTSLNCPLCRKRISIWVRKYPNYKNLVDQDLWSIIQLKFPKNVAARLENREDSQIYIPAASPMISTPGEIRREYQKELEMVSAELEMLRQKENDASIEVIAKIVEEENVLTETTIQEMKDICERDLALAKEIRQKQMSQHLSKLRCTPKALPFSPIGKSKTTMLDRFLEISPLNSGQSMTESLKMASTPKEAEVISNQNYLPSKRRSLNEKSMSNNGQESGLSLLNKSLNDEEGLNFSGFLDEASKTCNSQSTTGLSLHLSTSTDCHSVTKVSMESNNRNLNGMELDETGCQELNMSTPMRSLKELPVSNVSEVFQQLNMNEDELNEVIADQKAYDERKLQEEEDRRLAVQLEKEFKFVNRRKGTENEYSLRTTPKSSRKSQCKKRNRSLNQSTILETFAKRQKRS